MKSKLYNSLLERGKIFALDIQSHMYCPSDISVNKELRDWKISVVEQYANIGFEEQQALVGLSKIISGVLEDNKAMYYAVKTKELLERNGELF